MKEARPARTRSLLLSVLILGGLAFQSQAYYHPDEGRWLSRDPIGERGGNNQYGLLGNNAIDEYDRYGLFGSNVNLVCHVNGPEVGKVAEVTFGGSALTRVDSDQVYNYYTPSVIVVVPDKSEVGVVKPGTDAEIGLPVVVGKWETLTASDGPGKRCRRKYSCSGTCKACGCEWGVASESGSTTIEGITSADMVVKLGLAASSFPPKDEYDLTRCVITEREIKKAEGNCKESIHEKCRSYNR